MPALNFQKRFADAVESGAKRQTIRAPRRDGRPNATVGDRLYLYTGMRTKGCRKLGEAICTRRSKFVISPERTMFIDGVRMKRGGQAEYVFARADGFENALSMTAWFEQYYGLPFEGSLIVWQPA